MILRSTPRLVQFLLLGALLPLLLPVASAARSLRAGACKADITPISSSLVDAYEATFGKPASINHTDPVWMAGFSEGRAAQGYNDRLWARGVVLEHRGTSIAIVTLDLVGYFLNEIETIRNMITAPVDFVVVTSTHQHEGPDTIGIWGASNFVTGIDFGYLDFVNASVADCIDRAYTSRQRARLHVAETDSIGLSSGLDNEDDGMGVADGKVLEGDELDAPATGGRMVDPRLTTLVLTARRFPYPVISTLTSFASHPEALGSGNTQITSDFPHYARKRLEQEYGGTSVWVSGDLGVLQGPLDLDVEDPETGQPAPRRSFRFAEVHGVQLAERVIEAVDEELYRRTSFEIFNRRFDVSMPWPGHPAPRLDFATVSPVAIRLDNPFFRFLISLRVLNPRRDLFTDGVPDRSSGTPLPAPFDNLPQALGEDLQTEVSVLRIGDTQIAAVPNELDPQIGETYRRVLRRNGARHTMIFGLAGDELGYQVPFDKWDDSCHACFPYIVTFMEDNCPIQPIDCGTVFQNNVGRQHDPVVTEAFLEAVDAL